MALRKKNEIAEVTPVDQPAIRPLRFFQHWRTAGNMYRNYPGVDTNFDPMLQGALNRFYQRWVWLPLYFCFGNRGFGLWLPNEKGEEELAGHIYLQHRRMTTHINDIEVNKSFQGRGLSHILLGLAEQQARLRRKTFLTLAVTLTNTRAANLYRKSGFQEQHNHYFYLARPWWGEPDELGRDALTRVRLVPLHRKQAKSNLRRFFSLETRRVIPQVAPVWESLYQPTLPGLGQGFSFALYETDRKVPCGHADFFDWQGRGRWRIYLDPALWGSSTEQDFFALFLRQSRGYQQLGLMVGTQPHHAAALSFTRHLGLVERDTERMLMIRPLEN